MITSRLLRLLARRRLATDRSRFCSRRSPFVMIFTSCYFLLFNNNILNYPSQTILGMDFINIYGYFSPLAVRKR
jgi:hypothetical protein